VPDSVKKLIQKGYQIYIEKNAGLAANFLNEIYIEAGAKIVDNASDVISSCDIICKVRHPQKYNEVDETKLIDSSKILFGIQDPVNQISNRDLFTQKKISVFAMEFIPRISIAQSMDVLSSMATVAGYKAVLIATEHYQKFFPMFMTAAGTIPPTKVLILGAGVAGLQAIATARRLGAVVEVFDVRPEVKEQVESLGGKFIEMELEEDNQDAGGYAKQMSAEFIKKEMALIEKHLLKSDICICTAQVFGRKAPVLVKKEMVDKMNTGSVIVDLAAEQGGNCEYSKPGEVIDINGVTVLGPQNIASSMATHASQMYSKNLENLIVHLTKEEAKITIDLEDEVTAKTVIYHEGEVVSEILKRFI